ncbi:MAG TPA: NAD(P)-dependent oxidoreductase [Rhodothermales bacterium]|nr:NAD(P)-dependent oxidoreductase [Rhodothermales bacterium]
MPTSSLSGKTLFITGGSRGIGLAIAVRAARDGANVVIAAKTAEPHPRLPGTIHTAAAAVEAAGGQALAIQLDIRDDEAVAAAVAEAAARFGGIDVVVNNASAIFLAGTEHTPMKRFDLMLGVNVRGAFAVTQAAMPHLRASAEAGRNPHILTLAPPVNLDPRWLGPHAAYTLSKYGMTLLALGWAAELADVGVASNALWPRTTVATAAVQNLLGGDAMVRQSRTPEVVADAAHAVFTADARTLTGRCLIDEDVLREAGVTDFDTYAVEPGQELFPDLFL